VLDNVNVKTCPWSMTRTRSHCSTVCIECAMMMSVQSQNVSRIVSCIRAAVSESNDDVASSSATIYITLAQFTVVPRCGSQCQTLALPEPRKSAVFPAQSSRIRIDWYETWLRNTVVERRFLPANFPCPALDLQRTGDHLWW